jgi:hypothetical protein
MLFHPRLAILCLPVIASPVAAQSNVTPAHKHTWSENCGWLNWRDAGAPPGAAGARVGALFLSGFAWGENIGFINLGDGTPANGLAYANINGTDFGVNHNTVTGALSGLAWGENIGWINFSLPALPPAQQPRFDAAARRLRGYAWGENIGWINLDNNAAFVGVCLADFNGSGVVSVQDMFDYITAWDARLPSADFNGIGGVSVQDLFDFITAWYAACP